MVGTQNNIVVTNQSFWESILSDLIRVSVATAIPNVVGKIGSICNYVIMSSGSKEKPGQVLQHT